MKNFFFIALLALAFCGCQNNKSQQSSEADIEAMVNERVAAKLAEQGVESNTNSDVSASNNTAEASDGKTQYAYEFVASGTTYRVSFDKQEETAQLFVKGTLAPDGKTFYGSCNYDGLHRKGQICITGISGADDFDIHIKDEWLQWDGLVWIDYINNYIYSSQDAARAMNPDYRIAMKPIK